MQYIDLNRLFSNYHCTIGNHFKVFRHIVCNLNGMACIALKPYLHRSHFRRFKCKACCCWRGQSNHFCRVDSRRIANQCKSRNNTGMFLSSISICFISRAGKKEGRLASIILLCLWWRHSLQLIYNIYN